MKMGIIKVNSNKLNMFKNYCFSRENVLQNELINSF